MSRNKISPKELILTINSATRLDQVIDVENIKQNLNSVLKEIHPDVCNLPGATEATKKLNNLKDEFEKPLIYDNEAGNLVSKGYFIKNNKSNEKNLKSSYKNYKILKNLKDSDSKYFHSYLPFSMIESKKGLQVILDNRAICIKNIILPQTEINWILLKLLEFGMWINKMGYSHCGLNAENIFIVRETRELQICSFVSLTKLNEKVNYYRKDFSQWFPKQFLQNNIATEEIDIQLTKNIIVYLMGSLFNQAVFLGSFQRELAEFLKGYHKNPLVTYLEYRNILTKHNT